MIDSYRLYGQAMLEYLRGGHGRFTFVRDDGFRDPSNVKTLFAPYARWPSEERRALRYARGRVLDVGCGAGRVALYLQRRGLSVTAIDVSPEALECARLRGVRDAQMMDARHLSFAKGSFDTIVMFGNNLGVCGDLAATRRFLRSARAIARRGGRLLASTGVPAVWAKDHAAYVKKNVRRGLPPGLVRLRVVYKGTRGTWFPLLFVGTDDLLRLCEATGWTVEEVLTEPRRLPYYAFVAARA
jgi:SAM-dependent methyltransferase